MSKQIEILYKGIKRKVSKNDYCKLRPYNKIAASRVDTVSDADCLDYDPEELAAYNQRLKQEITRLTDDKKAMLHTLKVQNRLQKLINTKIHKVMDSQNGSEDLQVKDDQLHFLIEIKLELQAAELEAILNDKIQQCESLSSKSSKKKISELQQLSECTNELKYEFVGGILSVRQCDAHLKNIESRFHTCREDSKKIQKLLTESKRQHKKLKTDLEEAEFLLREAMKTHEERKNQLKHKKSEDYVQVKGGQLKSSVCLEGEISNIQENCTEIEQMISELIEAKMREKIRLNWEIQKVKAKRSERNKPSILHYR